MKKLFIVTDVHGFYDLMMESLTKEGFDTDNPDHIFVSCGDLLDRGEQPKECLQFVNNLPKDRKILIKGNHEELMVDMIDRKSPLMHDYHNGTIKTVLDYFGVKEKVGMDYSGLILDFSLSDDWKNYYNSLVDFYEDDKNIFVHGWIPCKGHYDYYGGLLYPSCVENWRSMSWDKARWLNGMELWSEGIKIPGKTIWCGHWHTSYAHAIIEGNGHEFSGEVIVDKDQSPTSAVYSCFYPFEGEGICAMDGCVAHSKHVNCKVVEVENINVEEKPFE